jgi:hypothetical protein
LFLDELGVRQPYCRPFLELEQFKEKNGPERMRQIRTHTASSTSADQRKEHPGTFPTESKDRHHDKRC